MSPLGVQCYSHVRGCKGLINLRFRVSSFRGLGFRASTSLDPLRQSQCPFHVHVLVLFESVKNLQGHHPRPFKQQSNRQVFNILWGSMKSITPRQSSNFHRVLGNAA